MLILIDTEKLIVVHRYPNRATLSFLAHIELAHTPNIIMDERGSFDHFSLPDLYVLYKNSNSLQEWRYGTHEIVSQALSGICESMPVSNVNSFEVTTQAMSISLNDKNYYRYRNGHSTPLKCQQQPVLEALTGGGNPAALLPPGLAVGGAPVAIKPLATPKQAQLATQESALKYAPPWA